MAYVGDGLLHYINQGLLGYRLLLPLFIGCELGDMPEAEVIQQLNLPLAEEAQEAGS